MSEYLQSAAAPRFDAPMDDVASAAVAAPRLKVQRLGWIDAAKGIGIVLVVAGHSIGGLVSAGLVAKTGPLNTLFYLIYTFHMPVFFFLSGLLVPPRVSRDHRRFLRQLLPTIVLPYFLWSIVQSLIIFAMKNYVNAPLNDFSVMTIVRLLWVPASQFWFLYALFVFHVGAALIVRRLGWVTLLMIGFGVFTLAVPEGNGIAGLMSHFLVFYALGALVGSTGDIGAWQPRLRDHSGLIIALTLTVIGLSSYFGIRNGFDYWSMSMFIAGVAGIALVLSIATRLPPVIAKLSGYLGERAMPIYVLHVLFVAGLRIALSKLLGIPIEGTALLLIIPAGIVGPLLIFSFASRLGLSNYLGLGRAPTPETGRVR